MIRNLTRKKRIAAREKLCTSIASKAWGLMLSPPIKNKGLIFAFDSEEKRELHMLFVFFPIDVLFLDSKKRVVELKENLRPFTLYFPKKKAQYIIELEHGAIRKSGTKAGDRIKWQT